MQHFSSVVGWIVSLGETLVRNEKTEVDTIREGFSDGSSMTPKNVIGWSICMYYLKEVSMLLVAAVRRAHSQSRFLTSTYIFSSVKPLHQAV